ncbi:MAG: hypothetical protein CVU48_01915 [Candidatus Cloacimonetes bacterium HGW-Cloacimonetes-1]|jgi:hypothetical protein|nr:MAG: hypothetical protein CVU48_01915 [Candidatus Cloacimonetes bacterium HGW-Cloacimonetes-1]
MSWIYGSLFKAKQHAPLPGYKLPLEEYHSDFIDIFAGGKSQTLQRIDHPTKPKTVVFLLGNPILRVRDDYRYPDSDDWTQILASEQSIWALDGHWLILIVGPEGVLAYNDSLSKRTMYFHESPDRVFFTNNLPILRDEVHPPIDYERFGAYWHSMFPPSFDRYAPTQSSYYQDIEMLGTGGKAQISKTGTLTLSNCPWTPVSEPYNLNTLMENMTLLPYRAGKRVTIGLSGGMDCRPLLALYLKHKVPVNVVNLGSDTSQDHLVAKKIASHFDLPFRHISYDDAGASWDQAVDYVQNRGVVFNPANSIFMGYYPILAENTDVYISGYFGELYRFRFMVAHLKSSLRQGALDYHAIADYLYGTPPSFFSTDTTRRMHQGFWHSLKYEVSKMPSSLDMPNAMWMNLFLVRHSPRSVNMLNLAWIDQHLVDHMPYLQSSIINGHWRYGFWNQLNEGLHRSIIREACPALENFPLALADASAPYYYRQYAVKVKMWQYYRKRPMRITSRSDAFLEKYKDRILEITQDPSIRNDNAISTAKLDAIVSAYYQGDKSLTGAMTGFLAFALGK